MILQTLQGKIGEAMKAHDEIRVSTLRLLLSAINYGEMAKRSKLSEEEELAVIRKEVKQRRDSIESYDKAGRPDLSEKEKKELTILQEFLPPEMSDEDLEKLVNEAIVQYKADLPADATHQALQMGMGKVIGIVKAKAPNTDGGKIAQIVKGKLS